MTACANRRSPQAAIGARSFAKKACWGAAVPQHLARENDSSLAPDCASYPLRPRRAEPILIVTTVRTYARIYIRTYVPLDLEMGVGCYSGVQPLRDNILKNELRVNASARPKVFIEIHSL